MTCFRPIAGLVLALCLAVASVGLAVARGQPPMSQWVELCAGGKAQTVAVDADGRPVGPLHLCPDCVAALAFADLPAPLALPLPRQGWTIARAGQVLPAQGVAIARLPLARGPPAVI